MAAKLAGALGVSLDYLVGNTDVELHKSILDKIALIQKLPDEAKKAVADLNNKDFMGRPLVVGGAKPKPEGDDYPRRESSRPAAAQDDDDTIRPPAESFFTRRDCAEPAFLMACASSSTTSDQRICCGHSSRRTS